MFANESEILTREWRDSLSTFWELTGSSAWKEFKELMLDSDLNRSQRDSLPAISNLAYSSAPPL